MSVEPLSEEEESRAYLATLRHFWPIVQQHDGSNFHVWGYAYTLHRIALLTIQRRYFQQQDATPAEEQALLAALEDLHENLTRNDGFMRPLVPGEWYKVVAQLSRVLPLVERLLAR